GSLIEMEPDARARILRAVEVGDLRDELVQAEARDLHLRRTRVLAEGVHHLLHALDLLHDGSGAALEDFGVAGVHAAEEAPPQPLGRELRSEEHTSELQSR